MSKPELVPINANKVDNKIKKRKFFVNKLAVACGKVNNERIRIIPTTLMFKTTVKAITTITKWVAAIRKPR